MASWKNKKPQKTKHDMISASIYDIIEHCKIYILREIGH